MEQHQVGFRRKKLLFLSLVSLAGLMLLASACSQKQQLEETGPNAKLTNDDLVKLAVATMKDYKSYHMEFHGGVPSEGVQMSRNMTITANMQFGEKGSNIEMSDDGKIEGAPYLMLGIGPVGLRIRD